MRTFGLNDKGEAILHAIGEDTNMFVCMHCGQSFEGMQPKECSGCKKVFAQELHRYKDSVRKI